jgi:putative transposase
MIESAVSELSAVVGITSACAALGRPRASHYRRLNPTAAKPRLEPAAQPRALSAAERQQVLDFLHEERFVDMAPASVYATLLDEGNYLASVPTMYRLLRSVDEVRERRRLAVHPSYVKPELVAWRPNMIWSWDITKLLGPAKWTYFYLYVVLDIFSRYVVGWMLASRELASLAERLLADSIHKQGVDRDQLTVHADRGSSMASKPVAFLLADLGVTKSHSRPHCPNDNPYSESQFKTLKYMPEFPERFGSQEHARSFCQRFFAWYNDQHWHSGLGYHTPADVHHGRAEIIRSARARVLAAAYAAHPERFVRRAPKPPALPVAAWINRPAEEVTSTN